MSDKFSVLLVDDHDAILEGIKIALDRIWAGHQIFMAQSPNHALQIIENNTISLAIVDISYGKPNDISGIELCEKIIKKGNIKIISFTGFYQISNLKRLLKINVPGIVSKYDGISELINGIQSVLKGQKYYSQEILSEFPHILFEQKKITKNKLQLTARQKQIVDLIAQAQTNQEIAEKLSLSIKTVEGHISNIALNLGLEKADRLKILKALGRII